ncbi:HNH endonuclease [Streptomyces werraensis]|uniref:HNH endonuclease n=1 Tax=Streptomyces werraensis TaxID=68284 RepID=UPI001CE2E0B2
MTTATAHPLGDTFSALAEHDDHAHPLAKGGGHSVWNMGPACAPCNPSKNDSELLGWFAGRSPGIARWLCAQGAL